MGAGPIRFVFLPLFVLLLFAYGETASARAAVEFCPATASVATPADAAFGAPSRTFNYDITALTPHIVTGTLIADTTAGWYAWSVNGVALGNTTRSWRPQFLPRQFYLKPYTIAASPTLAVMFPVALAIRHMWFTSAGATQCDVPSFDAASDQVPPNSDEVGAIPSPLYALANAMPAQPPFAFNGCDRPFSSGTVQKAVSPDIRNVMGGVGDQLLAATVKVALDPTGHIIEAWIFEGSGNAGFDGAALRAARLSAYSGSVSYCRPVNGTYVFIANLIPGS